MWSWLKKQLPFKRDSGQQTATEYALKKQTSNNSWWITCPFRYCASKYNYLTNTCGTNSKNYFGRRFLIKNVAKYYSLVIILAAIILLCVLIRVQLCRTKASIRRARILVIAVLSFFIWKNIILFILSIIFKCYFDHWIFDELIINQSSNLWIYSLLIELAIISFLFQRIRRKAACRLSCCKYFIPGLSLLASFIFLALKNIFPAYTSIFLLIYLVFIFYDATCTIIILIRIKTPKNQDRHRGMDVELDSDSFLEPDYEQWLFKAHEFIKNCKTNS